MTMFVAPLASVPVSIHHYRSNNCRRSCRDAAGCAGVELASTAQHCGLHPIVQRLTYATAGYLRPVTKDTVRMKINKRARKKICQKQNVEA